MTMLEALKLRAPILWYYQILDFSEDNSSDSIDILFDGFQPCEERLHMSTSDNSWNSNYEQYIADSSCGCCPKCGSSDVEAIDREELWTSVTFKCHKCGSWDHFEEGYPDIVPTHPYFTDEELEELTEKELERSRDLTEWPDL